jgi:fructosamine-3-kinase
MQTLPSSVLEGVRSALADAGTASDIQDVRPVTGGCINHGARVDVEGGSAFFLKWNPSAPPGLFDAEWDGLTALAAPGVLRVPRPLARGEGSDGPAWLLMEYVRPGRAGRDFGARLGRGLAELHLTAGDEATFGWTADNWIGSLPQENTATVSWSDFWRNRRLLPQLSLARSGGHFRGQAGRDMERLLDAVPVALEDVEGARAHLIHGDLWNGNVFADADGRPTLIDPAVYLGHGEVDLAMSELFGGFGAQFFNAYDEVVPVTPAYHAFRRSLYQLFYLLVHVNLFGASYEASALSAARQVTAALLA